MEDKKKLLLHCCCAPCATYVLHSLLDEYDITVFFYNPNIEPFEEYEKRKSELENLVQIYSLHDGSNERYDMKQQKTCLHMLECDYDNNLFADRVNLLRNEPEGKARCRVCFDIRLGETAKRAKEGKFDIFATTLSVSPRKNAAVLNDSGITQSADHNILYLEADFKKNNGYMQSVELSKKYGLYRQNYCGCNVLNEKR
ncbi:MAG: epoxyqueuosine reductase QueH [Oscillospiraceae bacterium]|nr:epoxyqueuosine reductase QueH [Oscillospiraceae bacterium]